MVGRRMARLLLTGMGGPGASGVRAAKGLGLGLAHLVGAGEPAKIARLVGVLGNEEADDRRWRRRGLLGLRQQRCRSQKSGRNDGKNDRSAHCSFLPLSLCAATI